MTLSVTFFLCTGGLVPVLTQTITETIVSVIESSIQSCVDSNIKPLIESVKRQQITINEQQEVIDGHSKQLTEIDLEPEFKSTSSLLFCFMEAAIFVVIIY
jgi:siroheme synthase (precorrin-2 oxidase/ferrochelatase)